MVIDTSVGYPDARSIHEAIDRASLRANALPRLSGNFLTMNLQQARAAGLEV